MRASIAASAQVAEARGQRRDAVQFGHIGEDLTTPQRERRVQRRERFRGPSLPQLSASIGEPRFEHLAVQECATCVDPIAATFGHEHHGRCALGPPGFEHLPQAEDIRLDRGDVADGEVLAPQRVGDPIHGHRPVYVDEQQRQHRPLLSTTEVDRGAVAGHSQRPEDREL